MEGGFMKKATRPVRKRKSPASKRGESFSAYDSADYLKSEKDIAAYLEAAIDEAGEDPAFIAHALGTIARSRGMAQLARDTGMTREGLYKALSASGNPSFATVFKVLRALGLRIAPRAA
jgi:probable addiction module antidote protein